MNWTITDNHGNVTEARIVISSDAGNLEAAIRSAEKDGWESATVEAEFGSRVITGSWATLAHHADGWRKKPCPCLDRGEGRSWPIPSRLVIGVSHFDLDTLGGVLALLDERGSINQNEDIASASFWHGAAFIDLNGPHRIGELDRSIHPFFNAFWAWSESHRLVAPRDKSVMDVTAFFQDAEEVLSEILDGDESRLAAGREWASSKEELERESFVSVFGFGGFSGLVRKSAGKFVNALYAHDGRVYDAIIGHNSETGAITLSFERPGILSAKGTMQKAFPDCQLVFIGKETRVSFENPNLATDFAKRSGITDYKIEMLAGGHDGIAGSPRNLSYSLADTERVIKALKIEA